MSAKQIVKLQDLVAFVPEEKLDTMISEWIKILDDALFELAESGHEA